MKRLVLFFSGCLTLLAPSMSLGHGGPEELGHHWASHEYIGEIHYQFALMAVLAVSIIVVSTLLRKRAGRANR